MYGVLALPRQQLRLRSKVCHLHSKYMPTRIRALRSQYGLLFGMKRVVIGITSCEGSACLYLQFALFLKILAIKFLGFVDQLVYLININN